MTFRIAALAATLLATPFVARATVSTTAIPPAAAAPKAAPAAPVAPPDQKQQAKEMYLALKAAIQNMTEKLSQSFGAPVVVKEVRFSRGSGGFLVMLDCPSQNAPASILLVYSDEAKAFVPADVFVPFDLAKADKDLGGK